MMSISIDPENDTPAQRMSTRSAGGAQWQHHTASHATSVMPQKASHYRGDRMNHQPVTLLRRAAGQPWVRLKGSPRPMNWPRSARDAEPGLTSVRLRVLVKAKMLSSVSVSQAHFVTMAKIWFTVFRSRSVPNLRRSRSLI
jgi:hypothetical protein